ncbi:MAG TPA: hypothetical protein VMJ90_07990 [Anaerolineales bacterium]|nr:hypothetical protein [Anaerolineales bacterium]
MISIVVSAALKVYGNEEAVGRLVSAAQHKEQRAAFHRCRGDNAALFVRHHRHPAGYDCLHHPMGADRGIPRFVAALAFLIPGAGTSLDAIGGAFTIARWRVIAIVIGTLWVGAIVIGFAFNFLHL